MNIASVYGMVSPDPSVSGESGRNSSEVHGASKAAVIQMPRYFAVHLAPLRIRVNCVSPGGVFAQQDPAFAERGAVKLLERTLYEETPYANPLEDIARAHERSKARTLGLHPHCLAGLLGQHAQRRVPQGRLRLGACAAPSAILLGTESTL